MLDAIRRIVTAECHASNSPRDPEFELFDRFPLIDNDAATTERVSSAFTNFFADVADDARTGRSDDPERTTPTTSRLAARTAVNAPFNANANVPTKSNTRSTRGSTLTARVYRMTHLGLAPARPPRSPTRAMSFPIGGKVLDRSGASREA